MCEYCYVEDQVVDVVDEAIDEGLEPVVLSAVLLRVIGQLLVDFQGVEVAQSTFATLGNNLVDLLPVMEEGQVVH